MITYQARVCPSSLMSDICRCPTQCRPVTDACVELPDGTLMAAGLFMFLEATGCSPLVGFDEVENNDEAGDFYYDRC